MMLQEKVMKESVKDRRDNTRKNRASRSCGNFAGTEGTALEEFAKTQTAKPYTVLRVMRKGVHHKVFDGENYQKIRPLFN